MARDYILSLKDEARLSAWHQQAQSRKKEGLGDGPCVTISREFGCQAYPLAAELASLLGEPWVVIDKEVLEEAAKVSGFTIEQIEKSRDTPPALKAIFAMFLDTNLAEETQVFAHLRSAIRKFASSGHCIIVGSGACYAARDVRNTFHLRLVAPVEFRIDKIRQVHGMEERQAREFINLHQKQREDFINRLAGEPVDNALHYHLVLNNGRMTPAQMARVVKSALSESGVG